MARKPYDDDDGRTIADMSMVTRRNLLFPRRPPRNDTAAPETPEPPTYNLERKEKRAVMLGALMAALTVGAVFIAAGALLIWLLITVWG